MNIRQIAKRMDAFKVIPLQNLNQTTRVKIVRNMVVLERALRLFQTDCINLKEKLIPEGFSAKLHKFAPLISPSKDSSPKEVESLIDDPEWDSFRNEYDRVSEEVNIAVNDMAKDSDYIVEAPTLTDVDYESIAAALPSGETSNVLNDKGEEVTIVNDELLNFILMNIT